MNRIFLYSVPIEIQYSIAAIFSVLIFCSISFWILSLRKKTKLSQELILRTNSWWYMAIGIAMVVIAPPIIGTILIGYVSFVALREMFSIGRFREADRFALFISYFVIPVQYYLAYKFYYHQFLCFIPLIVFIGIPTLLVLTGKTRKIGRSMSMIPTVLMLTVFMLSHMVLLFHFDVPNFSAGGGGLILFLVMLTGLNDVFQFTWGKLLGRKKILPMVSPNKTWAGFIGGVLSTACLAYIIRSLTPLEGYEAFLTGLIIGISGFIGDSIISAVKRDLRLKDTDDLIPGHGGAMDRLDSIIITTPIFYHLLIIFIDY